MIQSRTEEFDNQPEFDFVAEGSRATAFGDPAGATTLKPSYTRLEAGAQIVRDNIHWTADFDGVTRVSYAFRSTYADTTPLSFTRLDEAQINQVNLALQSWSDVANIVFERAGFGTTGETAYSDNATMLFANYNSGKSDGSAAYAYYPGSTAVSSLSGDVWINQFASGSNTLGYLSYGNLVITHEIGHAIGLQHPGRYNASASSNITYSGYAEYVEDTRQYTIMSYFDSYYTNASPGMYSAAPLVDDIVAVQRLYGANMSTRTGNTTYGFNSNADRDWFSSTSNGVAREVVFAVWDAGGNDTFDFSGYSSNQIINLNVGQFSNIGGLIGNVTIAPNVTIENAIGGSGNDVIFGNSADNRLFGSNGNDYFFGGAGNDYIDGGSGFDYVNYSDVTTNIEIDLALTIAQALGAAGIDTLISIEGVVGGSGNDALKGDANANYIDGGIGSDTLTGRAGDDTYIVDSSGDVVVELASEGVDVVWSAINYTIGANVENLTLTGASAINGTGNSLDNVIKGNDAANTLDGGTGNDTMVGNGGNDTYFVDSTSDTITELASGGDDIVRTSATYTLSENVETLVLLGSNSINGTGNSGSNLILGNSGDNVLSGGSGNDFLFGGNGNDYLDGGADTDFAIYSDALAGVSINLALMIAQNTGGAGTDTLVNVEGVYGTIYDDVLKGNDLANILVGDAGNDVISGGLGDDYLDGGSGTDTLSFEFSTRGVQAFLYYTGVWNTGEGNDQFLNFENAIGSAYDDVIYANSTGGTISGAAGSDVLGLYFANSRVTVLDGGSGVDTAAFNFEVNADLRNLSTQYSSGSAFRFVSIENLNGSGFSDNLTGDDGANTLDGGSGNDTLYGGGGNDTLMGGDGNDRLEGGTGVDRLDGGAGDDTISWDATDDLVSVLGGSGVDVLVFSGGSAPTSFDLTAHGFELAENRLTDTGANAWASNVTSYDSAWRTNFITVVNDNGSYSVLDYDQLGAFNWATNFNEYDAAGRLDVNVTAYDNGITAAYDFDQASSFNWVNNWNQYAANGALDINVTTFDNGTVTSNDFDQDSAFNWSSNWIQNDAAGHLDLNVTVFDNSVTSAYDYDQENTFNWVSNWNQYASGGALQTNVTVFDNGTRTVNEFDLASAFDWSTTWTRYDAAGKVDLNIVKFDNGNTAVIDYDQANEYSWASIWQLYDPNGNVIGYQGITDSGGIFGP